MRWLSSRTDEQPLRCAECGLEIQGTPVEAHGKLFCNPWHADRYPRTHPPLWKRIWRTLAHPDQEGGGGGCCR